MSAVDRVEAGEFGETKVNLRNFYHNRNFVDASYPQDRAEEWTQSVILDYRSIFTPGPVGVGVDVLGLYSLRLNSGHGHTNTQLLPVSRNGNPADDFGRLGVALKIRASKTELKVGEWVSLLPILRSDDGRSLPQTFQGAQVTSKELERLTVYAGQITGNSPRNDDSMTSMYMAGRPDATSDRFNFVGAEYTLLNSSTMLGIWRAQLEDIYKQNFLNIVHENSLGAWRLGANAGFFWGEEDGAAKAGDLDNKTASLLLSAKTGAHSLYAGLQGVYGDSGWMRVNGAAGVALANETFIASYDSPHEKSWQVRYDYNFVGLGYPGLTLMNRYISGSGVETASIHGGKEWARESELSYVVQSGSLRDLNIRWRNSSFRRNYSNFDLDENRLIISYPLSLF
ncbi:OprD family porin [Pseudomonas putida]|uniref:OprD family porin n=1 Tax=Pseudomonas putida TaxID=303 RepID=UPI002DB7C2A8|nr:OprD family porin [Pseudomonas putida]WRW06683.1 OprD family porin [Pseudomonas putida]